jgi:AraC-like DNA-binding protein
METSSSPDALGETFKLLQLDQTTYYHAEFFAPWAFKMTAIPKFHFVTSGRCWLKIDGEEGFLLEAGDFAILPHGKGHRIASDLSARLVDVASVPCRKFSGRLSAFKYGSTGARTTLICGDLNFRHPAGSHLISYLPKVMHVKAIANRSMEWIHTTARFMLVETKDIQSGGETIVTRLADILVVLAIRSWIEQNPQELTGWLTGLQDKRIGSAIAFIHQSPEKNWTLDALAEAAAMSRSAFSARFSKLVGEPAMKYVTRWRMHLASIYLRDGNRTIDDIAARLGYGSGPAFSRAVRRIYGKWPGDLRASMKSLKR